jgi:hypothetical protein
MLDEALGAVMSCRSAAAWARAHALRASSRRGRSERPILLSDEQQRDGYVLLCQGAAEERRRGAPVHG